MEEIKPVYVTFEQAKLLKEKGFDVPCIAFYDEEDDSNEINYYCNANHNVTGGISCWHNDLLSVTNSELDELGAFCYKDEEETESYDRITAPEQWQVEEWLRVEHGIWIYSIPIDDEMKLWQCRIIKGQPFNNLKNTLKIINHGEISYIGLYSPQEAYSAAFDYILKELI